MNKDLEVKLRISADGKSAITGLRQIDDGMEAVGESAEDASEGTDAMSSSLGGLAATAAGLLAGGSIVDSFIETNVEAGRLRASLETVTGSVESASAAWDRLNAFATQTPYSLAQSVDGFVQLKALGLDPSIEALESYGNTAAARGKDLSQFIEAVADASVGEFERLKEFGIKASKQGEDVALAFQGVTTTIKNNADDIQKYLIDIGNVQFAGAMEKQAATLGGAFSAVEDSVSSLFLVMGDTGASDALAQSLRFVAENLETLAKIAGAAGVGAIAAGAVKAAGALKTYSGSLATATESQKKMTLSEQEGVISAGRYATAQATKAQIIAKQQATIAAAATQELAAAKKSVAAAEAQLLAMKELSIYGAQRAAAERQLAAAIQARAAADSRATAATQIATSAQAAAAAAAEKSAAAQRSASAASSSWGKAMGDLKTSAGQLLNPLNAATAAMGVMLAYEVGAWAREASLGFAAGAEEGTLLARVFELMATEAEKSSRAIAENGDEVSRRLEDISASTGLAISNMEAFTDAVEKGALVFDDSSGVWQRGAVSLDTVADSFSRVDAALIESSKNLATVVKGVEEHTKVLKEQNQLSIDRATALGDEADLLSALASARQSDLAIMEQRRSLAEADLAITEKRLESLRQEAAQREENVGAVEVAIAGVEAEIDAKRRAVEMSGLAVDAARLESITAELATKTYGDQSSQLETLIAAHADLAAQLEADRAAQDLAAEAAEKHSSAKRKAENASRAYQAALADEAQETAILETAMAQATARVAELEQQIAAGEAATASATARNVEFAESAKLIEDAATDVTKATSEQISAIGKETELATKRNEVTQQQLALSLETAKARGDEAAQRQISVDLAELELQQSELNAEAKARESALLAAKAAALEEAGRATGEYTEAEQAQVAAAEHAAEVSALEAEKLALSTAAKREAVDAIEAQAAATRDGTAAVQGWAQALDEADIAAEEVSASTQHMIGDLESVGRTTDEIAHSVGLDLSALGEYAGVARDAFEEMYAQLINANDTIDATNYEEYRRQVNGVAESAAKAAERAASQAKAQDRLAEKIDEAIGQQEELSEAYDQGSIGLEEYQSQLRAVRGEYSDLSDEDIPGLIGAINDTEDAFRAQTQSALDGLSSWEAKLAGVLETEVAIQELNWQRDRLEAESALADARRNNNAEEIAALEQQIALIDQYYEIQLKTAEEADRAAAERAAQAAIEAANAEAAERARRDSLSSEERQYEDLITSLQDRLSEAILANDEQIQETLINQISAEQIRHEAVMENIKNERSEREAEASAAESSQASGERITISFDGGQEVTGDYPSGQGQTLIDELERLSESTRGVLAG